MIPPVFIIAFTGNRPKPQTGRTPAELEAMRPALARALSGFRDRAAGLGGEVHLFSSAAEGADTIVCEIAHSLGIPVHLILPTAEERFREDFEKSPDAWIRSHALIRKAEEGFNQGSLRIARSHGSRSDGYAQANHELLDAADLLLAVTNGGSSTSAAGSSAMMDAARIRGIPVAHLTTVGESPPVPDFPTMETDSEGTATLHALAHSVEAAGIEPHAESTEVLFSKLNQTAKLMKSRVSTGTKATIRLHGCASLLAALGVSYALANFPQPLIVLLAASIIEFVLIACAEWIHHRHHHDHISESWLDCRYAAELLRPLDVILPYLDALRPAIGRRHRRWHRFALSAGLLAGRPPLQGASVEELREAYIRHRIDDQILHYETYHNQAVPMEEQSYRWIRLSSTAALVVVVMAICYKISHLGDHHGPEHADFLAGTFYFLPIALPLLAGILSARRASQDIGRRSLRYLYMANLLRSARGRVATAPTVAALSHSVMETEDCLLQEIEEFYLSQKTGLKH